VPELPEVETVVRSLRPLIAGAVIRSAVFRSKLVTRGDFKSVARALAGSTILAVNRTGKHIFLVLDRGFLHIHLGMTGKLLWNGAESPYTRAVLETNRGRLVYDDIRQFGRVNYYAETPKHLAALGQDALLVSFEDFLARVRQHRMHIKALLLNQNVVSGVGNIYADEILFQARIHPKARADRLSKARIRRIFDAMKQVLATAIAHRGSSISDYVDSSGARGNFQNLHLVYGKTGEPCTICRRPVRRIVVAQRGTHYCPVCQRH
jgi:formamidopyrimidine-DNA glycosylase